jgi:hypothetical protein
MNGKGFQAAYENTASNFDLALPTFEKMLETLIVSPNLYNYTALNVIDSS